MNTPVDFLTKFSIRTADEIQRNIIRQGKRNAISRRYRAKDDKEAVAAWRLDFDRILRVFDVRSIISVWPPLTIYFQTKLEINTRVTTSGLRYDVANIRTTVPDVHLDIPNANNVVSNIRRDVLNTHLVRSDVANTRATASDVHHKLKSREGQNQAVSITDTLMVTE